jgi:hypothetical protein
MIDLIIRFLDQLKEAYIIFHIVLDILRYKLTILDYFLVQITGTYPADIFWAGERARRV